MNAAVTIIKNVGKIEAAFGPPFRDALREVCAALNALSGAWDAAVAADARRRAIIRRNIAFLKKDGRRRR